jgi:tryptophan synthase alpha chain
LSRVGRAFERARREGRAAFVAYLTAGDPDPDATVEMARALDRAGADVLELGVPFTDPIADGPVLQRAATRALDAGTTLSAVFDLARRIREVTDLALVLFSYVNPIYRAGLDRAAGRARDAGLDAVLLTDVPPEEAGAISPRFRAASLDTVFLVSPTSPPARMDAAARLSSGFLYVVSRAGTTGPRAVLPADLPATVRRARKAAGELPIAVGFGIASRDAAARAAALADGVVVGSALVEAAEKAGEGRVRAVERLAGELVAACRRTTAARGASLRS